MTGKAFPFWHIKNSISQFSHYGERNVWHKFSVNIFLHLLNLSARAKLELKKKKVSPAHCVWLSVVPSLLYFWYLNGSRQGHGCHAQRWSMSNWKMSWGGGGGAELTLPKDQVAAKHSKKILLLGPEFGLRVQWPSNQWNYAVAAVITFVTALLLFAHHGSFSFIQHEISTYQTRLCHCALCALQHICISTQLPPANGMPPFCCPTIRIIVIVMQALVFQRKGHLCPWTNF